MTHVVGIGEGILLGLVLIGSLNAPVYKARRWGRTEGVYFSLDTFEQLLRAGVPADSPSQLSIQFEIRRDAWMKGLRQPLLSRRVERVLSLYKSVRKVGREKSPEQTVDSDK